VLISWTAPDARGSVITAYTTQIRDSTSTLQTELNECNGSDSTIVSDTECEIEMSTFLSAPFSLSVGDEIIATVIAINAYGSSVISADSSSGATVKKAPSMPSSAPTLIS